MATAMINTPAAENTGGQRTPSHSSAGNSTVAGAIIDQGPVNTVNANPFATVSTTSAKLPSASSRHFGGSCASAAIPISSGATVSMPKAPDANRTSHTLKNAATEGPKRLIAAAPTAAVPVAATVAAKNPNMRRRLSIVK